MSQSGILSTTNNSGGLVDQINTDLGIATPIAGVIEIKTDNASNNAGSSVLFTGSTNEVVLHVTDANFNTIVGQGSGNLTLTGSDNVIIGGFSGSSLTDGSGNISIGEGNLPLVTTGDFNTVLGSSSAGNYTGNESSNIIIGYNIDGVNGESNTLRIGAGTGTNPSQINQSFIHGIRGVTPTVNDGIPVYISSTGQLGTVGTAPASITSITGDTGGAQTGPAITFAGGSTGLSFGGAANTITTTFAGITANGGTVSLATDATASAVNIGTGAGAKTVTVGSTNTTSSLDLKYGTGNFSLESATGTIIAGASGGEVTMPNQPAFLVYLLNTINNATGDGTFYPIVFDTVKYDIGSNINLAGPPTLFTAPVTGIYHFTCGVGYTNLTTSDTDGRILLTTTSQTFQLDRKDYGAIQTSGIIIQGVNLYTQMTAGDTAYLQTYVGVSTKTVNIFGDVNGLTFFSGVLVV